MEASGLGGPLLGMVLVPGLLAAGIGTLIFIGLDQLTGLGTLLPGHPRTADLQPSDRRPLPVGPRHRGAGHVPGHGHPARWAGPPVPGPEASAGLVAGGGHGGGRIGHRLRRADRTRAPRTSCSRGRSHCPGSCSTPRPGPSGALSCCSWPSRSPTPSRCPSFRGGPIFPAMFIGGAIGVAASHLPGLVLVPAVAMGIGAMATVMLKLPLTATLLAMLLLSSDGLGVTPLVIVAVVVAYVLTARLPQTPGRPPACRPRRPHPGNSPARRHRPEPADRCSPACPQAAHSAAAQIAAVAVRGCAGRLRPALRSRDGGAPPELLHPDHPGDFAVADRMLVHRWRNRERSNRARPLRTGGPGDPAPGVDARGHRRLHLHLLGDQRRHRAAVLRGQWLVGDHPRASPSPTGTARIWITFVEATIGLGLVALLISYLPTIYAAHHDREKGISVLRPFAGTPPSPVELLVNLSASSGGQPRPVADLGAGCSNSIRPTARSPPCATSPRATTDQSWVATVGSLLDAGALLLSASLHTEAAAADETRGR